LDTETRIKNIDFHKPGIHTTGNFVLDVARNEGASHAIVFRSNMSLRNVLPCRLHVRIRHVLADGDTTSQSLPEIVDILGMHCVA
jgi:hypothetical protein